MERDKATILDEISEALPEIVRGLAESRPISNREMDLTIAQVRALRVVGRHQDCTMGELARRLGIGLSAATGLVDRLVQRGLIEREESPRDRRVVCLGLAPRGKRAREALRREKRRRMGMAARHLSSEQLEQIAASLALLRKAVTAGPEGEEEE